MSEAQRHNGLDADPEGAFVYYSRLMTVAAMAVLRATTDLNQYIEREDLLK